MENFIFYYTLLRDFNRAQASMQDNTDFTKEFLQISKKICALEAQTFLTDDSKEELKKEWESLQKKILYIERNRLDSVDMADGADWRVLIALMCTFDEWCHDTNFFNLTLAKQTSIFSENPVDGYFGN